MATDTPTSTPSTPSTTGSGSQQLSVADIQGIIAAGGAVAVGLIGAIGGAVQVANADPVAGTVTGVNGTTYQPGPGGWQPVTSGGLTQQQMLMLALGAIVLLRS